MAKYKFKIENETHERPNQFITGREVRDIEPGIPDTMDLFLKLPGEPGRLVKDNDRIDLGGNGIEKFYAQDASSEAGAR